MPRIDLPDETPGPMGPLSKYPKLAWAMIELDEIIMRGDSPLSPGERELIGAFVSAQDDCTWCTRTHSTTAAKLLEGGEDLVDQAVYEQVATSILESYEEALSMVD